MYRRKVERGLGTMALLDALTNHNFKKDESGKTTFYPHGILGRAYIVPDAGTENRIKSFLRHFYIAAFSLSVAFYIALLVGTKLMIVTTPGLVLFCILSLWYYFRSRSLLATCRTVTEKQSIKDRYAAFAATRRKSTLWVLFIFSWLFVMIGLSIVIRRVSLYDAIAGIWLCLFFSWCGIVSGYMIRVKRRSEKDRSR